MIKSVRFKGEQYFKIENIDGIRPFLMSVVSASNHWMFIGSNGGLTAGRKNADFALFPYYTDDKIIESAEITGSKTIVQVHHEGKLKNWEPFSVLSHKGFNVKRNLYKNQWGNKIVFEEVNETLNLVFRYQWNSSNLYGFVRKASLTNLGNESMQLRLVDGIQNIVPFGVASDVQNTRSNLVDAYKRSELDPETGLGMFALSAIIVDKAEPSEALKANVAWAMGIENPTYLVSNNQLNAFRKGEQINQEVDVKAEKGAYFIATEFTLQQQEQKEWFIVANVNQNHAGVYNIIHQIKTDENYLQKILADVELGTQELIKLTASADGLQKTADPLKDARHFANTMFNIMRGGIFDHNYTIELWDFKKYLKTANVEVFKEFEITVDKLPATFSVFELQELVDKTDSLSFKRLATEYLPLKFSRRHGDPSRPWNKFSINTVNEDDGSKILDYEGNWRDIFQNWEALAWSYPAFIEGMIYRFLNASTFDGYNPYRITKDGFDWETIEPDDPWSYIGYWGDHQVIYLLKFLEFLEKYQPGKLVELFHRNHFVYAAVPYKIKPYEDILKNTKDTIDFDHKWDHEIRASRNQLGSDGALLKTKNAPYHVNFLEKILATTLAKVANLIPEAGIWMNTQRPEWNDANNALVGNGVSMVTLYYLRRFLTFFRGVFADGDEAVEISTELFDFFNATDNALKQFKGKLEGSFSDEDRKQLMDLLGKASTDYRNAIYQNGFSGEKEWLSMPNLKSFIKVATKFMEHAIEANKRDDNLYHGYNIISISENKTSIEYLDEQLEGQVGVLSSGYLNPQQVIDLLNALRKSKLYREDQNSYILYPFKNLPGFLQKNTLSAGKVEQSKLLSKLVADNNVSIIERDITGKYHFNGGLRNAFELEAALINLDSKLYGDLVTEEKSLVHSIYEELFNHKAFTGRSTTFYGYEGLGSIYWHMVSKLLLAVEECSHQAIDQGATEEQIESLKGHFHEIFEGIGVHKSPEIYGAFSTDPYSHTPYWKGAQQPGMTGQVKEDVMSRFGELGITLEGELLKFNPKLLNWEAELLNVASEFNYFDVKGQPQTLNLEPQTLLFTYCQVPVIYKRGGGPKIEIHSVEGSFETVEGLTCNAAQTQAILNRTGEVVKLVVFI